MKKEDTNFPRPSLFNLRQLSLVAWLLDAPSGTRRFMIDTGKTRKFYETGAPRAEDGLLPVSAFHPDEKSDIAKAARDEFGGSFKFDPWDLFKAGILGRYERRYPNMAASTVSFEDKVADIYIPGKWNLGSVYYEIGNDWAREWYAQSGKARREKLLAALREKEAATRRRAVFGRMVSIQPIITKELAAVLPAGYHFTLPSHSVLRPCMVATIVAETEKRFKVRDAATMTGGRIAKWGMTTEVGREEYVERELLMLDNATDADIAKLVAFDEEYALEVNEIGKSVCEEIMPIIARMAARVEQKKGQHGDMLADLLASLKKDR
ncbi:hypothetical protein [Rhizobium sp. BK176]|uniref:hypothetical protein n=1 Tax=Rhizobium sp. BK176 TaxID=2587071 RepID=UPI002167E7B3|nr:hypothetical protein [Rhizobium sp. BK176]MCS4088852.1 hypothetical protein [Rhizobium sp. BK176]